MLPDPPIQKRLIHHGVKFDVLQIDLPDPSPDAPPRKREVIVHPGAVVILPVLDDGQIVLIRNNRFAVGETLWELPAGTLEPPEPPADCAARELIEETGFQAGQLIHATDFYSCPGFCTELLYAYVATDLKHVGQQLEDTEEITVEPRTLQVVLDMIRDRTIRDAKTIAAVLYYHAFMRNQD